MIRLLIAKELRETIGSRAFIASFAACAALILLTFYVGAKTHRLNVARHEAAVAGSYRAMEGVTDWMDVRDHRIFLPPRPLEALVGGVSNDIGRTISVRGRGELDAEGSRFNEDPLYAVFRFLDLGFVFQVVMSLFAILFAFGAVNGEKERGTLRLAFANPVPRASFLVGKWAGAFLAVCVPMLVPLLLGCLLLPAFGVHLEAEEWWRLALVLLAGFLFFGSFLSLSILASTVTRRSSSSFLVLLIAWIFLNLVVPRTAVLLAGNAVAVSSIDDINARKARYLAQLVTEDTRAMESYKPASTGDPERMMQEFNDFMDGLHTERDRKMKELSDRLGEQRRNGQRRQRRLAFGLARISPFTSFTLAADRLAGASLELGDRFLSEAYGYQATYGAFMKEKTGMNTGARMIRVVNGDEEQQKQPINPAELPAFVYRGSRLDEDFKGAAADIGLLILFSIVFFAGSFVAFLRFDVR